IRSSLSSRGRASRPVRPRGGRHGEDDPRNVVSGVRSIADAGGGRRTAAASGETADLRAAGEIGVVMKKKTVEQMTLSGSEAEIFARLQDRVEKAIAMIQELRRERDALKAKLEGGNNREEECERLRKERDEIRNRIESILSNLESLDV